MVEYLRTVKTIDWIFERLLFHVEITDSNKKNDRHRVKREKTGMRDKNHLPNARHQKEKKVLRVN